MIYNQHVQLELHDKPPKAKEHRKSDMLKFIPCPSCGRKQLYQDGYYVECRHCDYWRVLPPGQDF